MQVQAIDQNLHPLLLYGRRLFVNAVFPAGFDHCLDVVPVGLVEERAVAQDEAAAGSGDIDDLFDVVLHFLHRAKFEHGRGQVADEAGVLTERLLHFRYVALIDHPGRFGRRRPG